MRTSFISVFSGIAILLCVCLHCVTSDNSNETTTSTAFPIFDGATQEHAPHALIKNISPLITTTTIIPQNEEVTIKNVPSPQTTVSTEAETSLPEDKSSNVTKSNSTILSVVPIVNSNNDVIQSPNAERQEKDIDITTQSTPSVTIKQTDLSTPVTEQILSSTTSTTTTTQSTTITLPLSDKTTSSTLQVSVTEKTLTTTTTTSSPASVDLCLESHIIKLLPDPKTLSGDFSNSANNQFFVNVTKGDITITVISKRLTSAQFVVNRINELNLIRDNVTLGELIFILYKNEI